MTAKPKAVVVLSGGQDSTTCLFWALEQGFDVYTLTINYGQRHWRELDAASAVAKMAGIPLDKQEILNVGAVLQGTSPLVSSAGLEQYADHNSLPGGLEKTFVPMRNQLFLTLAANRAFVLGANTIVTGVCQEDFGGYPDCRRDFIDILEAACNEGTFCEAPQGPLTILTPLMHLTKAQSVELAYDLPGCYDALAYTHTAYDGLYPPLGHDHASLLRAKGFIEAGKPDPLVLRAVAEGLMAYPSTPNYSRDALLAVGTSIQSFPYPLPEVAQ